MDVLEGDPGRTVPVADVERGHDVRVLDSRPEAGAFVEGPDERSVVRQPGIEAPHGRPSLEAVRPFQPRQVQDPERVTTDRFQDVVATEHARHVVHAGRSPRLGACHAGSRSEFAGEVEAQHA